jgi:hypothetical protein
MKILFSADIHIKLGQKNVPVIWAKNRYNSLWKQLQAQQKECELFVIGGDVFDKLPNMEELECFFDLVSSCIVDTIIYPGNHEAVKKDTTFLSNLKVVVSRLNPLVRIIDDFYTYKGVDFVPYNKLKELEKTDFVFVKKVLCTHVRGEIPPHVKPEIDLDIFNPWTTVLAGDLHSYENSQRNILYPGSPCTTSFHRNVVDTGVIVFDTTDCTHEWNKLELPQLIRKTVGVHDEKLATQYHHTIYEIEGDMAELAELENSDLIDKKVIKRATEATLILDPTMTLSDEVVEYLNYILELPSETVTQVLKEMQNYADKFEQ